MTHLNYRYNSKCVCFCANNDTIFVITVEIYRPSGKIKLS
jgi:hypothetical protein